MEIEVEFNFRKPLIIFGLNDLAELAHFYFKNDSYYNEKYWIKGFIVNKEYKKEDKFLNLPVFEWESWKKGNFSKEIILFAPVTNNQLREKIYNEGKQLGYKFLSYVSSKCTNFADKIGENCFILEDNTIQPFTTIGNNVIMWSGNHLGHHSTIEDNVFMTSHCVVSGHCNIKKGAFLGVNSTLRDGIIIGENSVVGMGSLVTRDIPNNETWLGSPAKKKVS